MWFAVTQEAWCQIFVSICAVGIENLFLLWKIIVFNFLFLLSLNSYTVSEIPFHVSQSVRHQVWFMRSVLNPAHGHTEDQLLTVHPAVHGVITNRKHSGLVERSWLRRNRNWSVWDSKDFSEKKNLIRTHYSTSCKRCTPLECTLWSNLLRNWPVNQGTMISGLPVLERCGVPTMTQKLM